MPLVLTEEETMLVDSAKRFLATSAPVGAFRALRDSGNPACYLPSLWSEMVDLGFAGMLVAESDGGTGFGYTGAGLIAEQAGRVLAASPLLSSALAAEILSRDGSADQKLLLASIADGSLLVAFAIDEQNRHAPDSFSVHLTADAAGYRLDGTKRMVVDGGIANKLIVAASTATGVSLVLIDASAPGVAIKPLALIDSRNAADIVFTGVKLDASMIIGKANDARATINRALDVGRTLLAAELLGIAQEAFDRTLAYLKEREQFGVKIGSFQALQHRTARMYANLYIAHAVVMKAMRGLDEGNPAASLLASLAKGTLTKTTREVVNEAIQMHGGIGVTDDLDLGLFFKRARVAGEIFGDDYFQRERLARLAWKL